MIRADHGQGAAIDERIGRLFEGIRDKDLRKVSALQGTVIAVCCSAFCIYIYGSLIVN